MTQARDVMQSLLDAYNAHQTDRFLSHFADQFVYEVPGRPPIHDLDEFKKLIQMVDEVAIPDSQVVGGYVVADDSRAVFVGRWTGTQTGAFTPSTGQTLPPSGRHFDTWFVMAIECRDGKIVRHQDFFDRADWLRQVVADANPATAQSRG